MERQTKVKLPSGEMKPATEVSFEIDKEPWAIYQLADGTQVRAKVIVTHIFRLDGDVDENGDPQYYVRHTVAVATTPGPGFNSGPMTNLQ